MTRQTANHWRSHDQRFIDELRYRQSAMAQALRDQLLALVWKVMDVLIHELEEGNPKIALELGKSLGLLSSVELPDGPSTFEELEEYRMALNRAASQAAVESKKDREKRAHLQARAEAERAYSEQLTEAMTPMDEEVYERRLGELLRQQGSTQ